ncbi:hypothetical protein TI39_contig4296g00001, partial [Zymoseptoria brevis]
TSTTAVAKPSVIRILNADDNSVLGYLSRDFGSAGRRVSTTDLANALLVSIEGSDSSASTSTAVSAVSFISSNSAAPADLIYLSGVLGGSGSFRQDFGPGSGNFAYIAASNPTPQGSSPIAVDNSFTRSTSIARNAETAIWTYDPQTGALSAFWVNTDGSLVPTIPFLFTDQGLLFITGDISAFRGDFGTNDTPVKLEFVE